MSSTLQDKFDVLGATLDNKYYVSRVIAEGGFGVVYQATHIGLQKPVALKILKIPRELTEATRHSYLENFAQEARLIATLEHPAIVRVIDFGVSSFSGGVIAPWTALEWLEGTTLEAHLEQLSDRMISPLQVFGLMERVLDAIAFAHEEGVVHRDLKPSNLMLVVSRRGESLLKVLDFGIAKTLKSAEDGVPNSGVTQTSSRLIAFSPQYAAPEQLTGMRTGPWTDIHALGLILVELLCGRPALVGADVSEIYSAALSPVRPTPASLGVDVGGWEPILARALAFRPNDRFANARALLDALRSSLHETRHGPLAVAAPISGTVVGVPHLPTFRGAEVASPPVERRRPGLLVGAGIGTVVLVLVAAVVWRQSTPDITATLAPAAVPVGSTPSSPPLISPSPTLRRRPASTTVVNPVPPATALDPSRNQVRSPVIPTPPPTGATSARSHTIQSPASTIPSPAMRSAASERPVVARSTQPSAQVRMRPSTRVRREPQPAAVQTSWPVMPPASRSTTVPIE